VDGWRLWLFGLAVGIAPGGSTAAAQVPPKEGAPAAKLAGAERARRLQERGRHRNEAVRLANSGRLDEAVHEVEAALAIEREILGELSEGAAGSLAFLANLHERSGNWAAARGALQDLLALRERQPDRRDWRVGDARQALADVERRAAMTPDQRQRYWRALRLHEQSVGLRARGQYRTAEALIREVIPIVKILLGEDHPNYAISLSNLGDLYRAMGDRARAEPLLRRAMEITRKAVGEGHPTYATSLNHLGKLYRAMGDRARAEALYHRAMEIYRKAVGEGHPDYATSLSNLGSLYLAMGDYPRAEPLLCQALEIEKKAVGEDHPAYATSLNHLGWLYLAMGDRARAESPLRRALEIRKRAVGEGHRDYAASLNNLGALYQAMGDYPRAEPLLRRAMEIAKKAVGEDHPDYALSLGNLGRLYRAMGDSRRAEPWLREALERQTALFNDTASALGERPRMELLQSLRVYLDSYLSVAQQAGVGPEALYRGVLAWKGASVALQSADRLVRDRPELRPVVEGLASVRAQLVVRQSSIDR
jgi:tetratricopeptide (TPR) repeat protein